MPPGPLESPVDPLESPGLLESLADLLECLVELLDRPDPFLDKYGGIDDTIQILQSQYRSRNRLVFKYYLNYSNIYIYMKSKLKLTE